ncbi:MAG: ABC transporter permease [Acidobacteriota bacterium]|nr:ABC transporter permease [Acidobacteriota bacterium]
MPNRKMFWRVVRRLFGAHRGRLLVILLALGSGAALTAALLNLQVDAKRRLTSEFRVLGTNVVVAPREPDASSTVVATFDESVIQQVRQFSSPRQAAAVSYLYLVGSVKSSSSKQSVNAVIAGKRTELIDKFSWKSAIATPVDNRNLCAVGSQAAEQLHVQNGDRLTLRNASPGKGAPNNAEETCSAEIAEPRGDAEDSQIVLNLDATQRLAGLPGKISLIQISVTGTPHEIRDYIAGLSQSIPSADVHGLRQYTDAEAKIYDRISGLLTATIVSVLILTALCVMAAMTNVAMERKNDVALMKAIGGATRRVLRLFLAEAALLGLAGGAAGAAIGLLLSVSLGKAVFGISAHPRWIVYPISVALTVIVAIVSSYPLRRLASSPPASVFRGEA